MLIYHGTTTLPGTPGPRATAKFFEAIGVRPGRRYATLAALTELVAGIAIVLGSGSALLVLAVTRQSRRTT